MDGTPPSKAALEHALAMHEDAEIIVLHVVETVPRTTGATGEPMAFNVQDEKAEEHASQLFDEAQRIADGYGIDLTTVTEIGKPARTIIKFAGERGVNHIIIGSHGRTGVSRLLFGSVAEQVVRQAPAPVTIV